MRLNSTARSQSACSAVLFPAGWTLRYFGLGDFTSLISEVHPPLVEISKDFLRDDISLKALGFELGRLRAEHDFELAYAGTTDFISCAGLDWQRYRRYLAVQAAQAKFLGCSVFRALVGMPRAKVPEQEIIQRLRDFCEDMQSLDVAIEIDGGAECNLPLLKHILEEMPIKVVVDFENMDRSGISMQEILITVPLGRIAYCHQRNLPGVWTEHENTLDYESEWHRIAPDAVFLWETKKLVEPDVIKELYLEYRTAD